MGGGPTRSINYGNTGGTEHRDIRIGRVNHLRENRERVDFSDSFLLRNFTEFSNNDDPSRLTSFELIALLGVKFMQPLGKINYTHDN